MLPRPRLTAETQLPTCQQCSAANQPTWHCFKQLQVGGWWVGWLVDWLVGCQGRHSSVQIISNSSLQEAWSESCQLASPPAWPAEVSSGSLARRVSLAAWPAGVSWQSGQLAVLPPAQVAPAQLAAHHSRNGLALHCCVLKQPHRIHELQPGYGGGQDQQVAQEYVGHCHGLSHIVGLAQSKCGC